MQLSTVDEQIFHIPRISARRAVSFAPIESSPGASFRIMFSGPTLDREKELWSNGYRFVAGVDEAGRGCLAGPVFAAAAVFPKDLRIDGVTDSKLIGREEREELAEEIERKALSIGVGICSPKEIDKLNILWAAMEAMRRAVAQLAPAPHFLLIDGNHCFPDSIWPLETIIKGDLLCHSIAAASIIAKVRRDRLMRRLHSTYPVYCWNTNVGYSTPEHRAALAEHGPTPYHRRSFKLCADAAQGVLNFAEGV